MIARESRSGVCDDGLIALKVQTVDFDERERERKRKKKDRSMDPIRSGSRPIQCLLYRESVLMTVDGVDAVPSAGTKPSLTCLLKTFLCLSGSKAGVRVCGCSSC